jgi:hypothetical protein
MKGCLPAETCSTSRIRRELKRRVVKLGGPVLLFLFTLLLFYSPALAQDFDYNRAFNDYIYNYNLYRSTHLEYVTKKSGYQTYGTLTSQTEALEATRKMLLQRDKAFETYLTAIRMKLKEETGVESYKQNLYFLKLDDEVAWLKNHQSLLSSPSTIEDLIKESSRLETRFPDVQIINYQALGVILEGKEIGLREEIKQLIYLTEKKIVEIRDSGEETQVLERWLLEAKQKVVLSEQKQAEATTLLSGIKPRDTDKLTKYDQARRLFEESNQYLKEAISFLKEIIREVKRV